MSTALNADQVLLVREFKEVYGKVRYACESLKSFTDPESAGHATALLFFVNVLVSTVSQIPFFCAPNAPFLGRARGGSRSAS
jgi:hypothetical protein